MAKQVFTNNASAVLTIGINAVATSIILDDASKFPSPTAGDYFLAALIGLNVNGQEASWEIVKCTDRTSNTLTVVRAQEGTTGAIWGVGVRIEVRVTAVFANDAAVHMSNVSNPHSVTKAQVGLTNVDNTSDVNKPVSTAQATAIGLKQDTLVSGTNIKTVNGTSLLGSGDVPVGGALIYPYDSRASLRSLTPVSDAQVIVTGLGYFVWYAGSTELDDDETCFATASGAWLLSAVDPEYVCAATDVAVEGLRTDMAEANASLQVQTTALQTQASALQTQVTHNEPLRGSFSMSLTTLATLSESTFTATVTGAAVGDTVVVNPGNVFGTATGDRAKLSYAAYVSAANTVSISVRNASSATAAMTASTWSVVVIKQ